jgi:hypothetical protein
MAVRMLMTWDILPGREQEYFEFVVREFVPAIQRLGLETSDAWYTVYGDQPQIMVAVQSSSLAKLDIVLKSPDWENITHQLLDYVEDFKVKVVPAKAGFQL